MMGLRVSDVLTGLDFDLLAGGLFRTSAQFSALTAVNVNSYWIGAGSLGASDVALALRTE
jgi:long-chain fatty acid transport protein